MKRAGLALLEVLVALVILGLLVVGYLRLFQGGHRVFARSREWSMAIEYASDAMERAKLELPGTPSGRVEDLPGGLRRRTTSAPWQPGVAMITVTVALPDGRQLQVYRLGQEEGAPAEAR